MSLPFSAPTPLGPGQEIPSQRVNDIEAALVLNRTDLTGLSGTWTPEVRIALISDPPIATTVAQGEYVVTDSAIIVSGRVTYDDDTSGEIFITGLPFRVDVNRRRFGGAALLNGGANWGSDGDATWQCEANDTGLVSYLRLARQTSGTFAFLDNPAVAFSRSIYFHAIGARL